MLARFRTYLAENESSDRSFGLLTSVVLLIVGLRIHRNWLLQFYIRYHSGLLGFQKSFSAALSTRYIFSFAFRRSCINIWYARCDCRRYCCVGLSL